MVEAFAAIFVGTRTLDLSRIGKLEFIVDGEIRGLSQVMLDASGSFVVDEEAPPPGRRSSPAAPGGSSAAGWKRSRSTWKGRSERS
ncbi:MAG: hypothetical protein QHH75_14190 [Bacillota bacterium]|nr:hypothetical protein [Bacillota bacterium]